MATRHPTTVNCQKYQKYQNRVLTVGVKSITPFRGIHDTDTNGSKPLSKGYDTPTVAKLLNLAHRLAFRAVAVLRQIIP